MSVLFIKNMSSPFWPATTKPSWPSCPLILTLWLVIECDYKHTHTHTDTVKSLIVITRRLIIAQTAEVSVTKSWGEGDRSRSPLHTLSPPVWGMHQDESVQLSPSVHRTGGSARLHSCITNVPQAAAVTCVTTVILFSFRPGSWLSLQGNIFSWILILLLQPDVAAAFLVSLWGIISVSLLLLPSFVQGKSL